MNKINKHKLFMKIQKSIINEIPDEINNDDLEWLYSMLVIWLSGRGIELRDSKGE